MTVATAEAMNIRARKSNRNKLTGPRRLERETPWHVQRVGSLIIGLILLVISSLAYIALPYEAAFGESDSGWVLTAFILVFGVVGALLAFNYVHQTLAMRVPETSVEIERDPFRLGRAERVNIQQRGPVRLRSLRANLICMEHKELDGDASPAQRLVYSQIILEENASTVVEHQTLDRTVEFCLPPTEHASGRDPENQRLSYVWKIEIWGRVAWWPGFMHPFVVEVNSAGKNSRTG